MLDTITKDDFISHVHEHFLIHIEGIDPVDLELVSVNVSSEPAQAGRRQPFSLHFLGPVSQMYLEQHIYPLENTQFGTLELFIVPLGPEAGRMRYEAVIA